MTSESPAGIDRRTAMTGTITAGLSAASLAAAALPASPRAHSTATTATDFDGSSNTSLPP